MKAIFRLSGDHAGLDLPVGTLVSLSDAAAVSVHDVPDVQLHTSNPAVELLTALYFHLM
jgi:hypothetical protein